MEPERNDVAKLLAAMRGQQLRVLNCHLHSEASDFLGALRPARRESGGALFEWVDGCLVEAMRRGEMVLLDELNLADDAVLERLNSVLEPARTIALAEKGGDARVWQARGSPGFLATMNPGGDHGKRELSPALRSRFTEIWAPACSSREDLRALVATTLPDAAATEALLDFGEFIKGMADDVKPPPLTATWSTGRRPPRRLQVAGMPRRPRRWCWTVWAWMMPCVENGGAGVEDAASAGSRPPGRGMDGGDAGGDDAARRLETKAVYGAAPFALGDEGDFNGAAFCDDAPTNGG